MGDQRLLAAVLVAATTGCSAVVDDAAGVEVEASEQAQPAGAAVKGSVSVARALTHAGGADAARSHVSARFIRVTGSVDVATAEQLVGAPMAVVLGADGGCAWAEQPAEPQAELGRGADGAIELIDAGEIVLLAGDRSVPLAQRAFPDVGDLVSGVVYTSRDDSLELPAAGRYALAIGGSEHVAGFEAELFAPAAPAEVRIDGQPIEAGELRATVAEALPITWQAGQGTADDRIVVELVTDSGPLAARTLRCAFDDTGHGELPRAVLGEWGPGTRVELSVHRYRQVHIDATGGREGTGAPDAVVDFDFAVAARLALEP